MGLLSGLFGGSLGAGLGLAGSLYGMIESGRQQKRLAAERQRIILDATRQNENAISAIKAGDYRDLMAQTGDLRLAVGNLTKDMGANLAAGGITNASTVAGAGVAADAAAKRTLAETARSNASKEVSMRGNFNQWLTGQKLGIANQDYAAAADQTAGYGTAIAQLASLLAPATKAAGAATQTPKPKAASPVAEALNQFSQLSLNGARTGYNPLVGRNRISFK